MKEKLTCLYDDANYCNPKDCGLYSSNRMLRTEIRDKVIELIQEIKPTEILTEPEDTPYIDPTDLELFDADIPCPHFKPTKIRVRKS